MSEVNIKEQDSKNKSSLLKILLGIFIFFTILYFLYDPTPFTKEQAYKIKCMANLKSLGKALQMYAQDHNNIYPTAEKWCDLLVNNYVAREEFFRCPWNKESRCNYAMNPQTEPNSPADIILLFESTAGWNQFGGPELLNTENHNGDGCFILFNNAGVEFVDINRLEKLNWQIGEIGGNE